LLHGDEAGELVLVLGNRPIFEEDDEDENESRAGG